MRAMFSQFFATFTLFFAAMEKLASATFNITSVLDETSASYVDEIRAERQARITNAVKALK